MEQSEPSIPLPWRMVFKDQAFPRSALQHGANLFLLGKKLEKLSRGQCGLGEEVYLDLTILDWSGDFYYSFRRPLRSLLDSLNGSGAGGDAGTGAGHEGRDGGRYNDDKCEVIINVPDGPIITLNIWHWARCDDATAVQDVTETLLERKGSCYQTYMMFYGDSNGNPESQNPPSRMVIKPNNDWRRDMFFVRCSNYLVRGGPVQWLFYEWTGTRSVDGRVTAILDSWSRNNEQRS